MKTLIGVLLLALLCVPAGAQQVDPAASYRTVDSEHFRVTYTPELKELAALASERAEEAYRLLQQQLAAPPRGRIDVLLSDNSDISNGFASPFSSNRITVFVKPPVGEIDLVHYRNWFDLVITHELAHIFHLDVAGSVGRALRGIFGRVPWGWPAFPATESPRWLTEGLAVEFETRGTGSARLHGAFHEMVVRTAVLEGEPDPIDRISGDTPIWPGGQRAYIYGSLFMDYLARKHGPSAQANIVRRTAGSILPARLVLNRIGNKALGESLVEAYETWQGELRHTYDLLRDSLVALGLTDVQRITAAGRYAQFPRVSPDGRFLAFAEEDGRSVSRTHVLETATGRTAWRLRRNGIGPSDWLPDGTLITAQFEVADRYALRSDLFRIQPGREQRLTKKARLEEPDVDATGTRVVAVELQAGTNRLVLLDTSGAVRRALKEAQRDTMWSAPRWSPDGTRIAAVRWIEGGRHDIVVLDTLGVVLAEATSDEAVDATPAWSPDGRYVLFWSDRTGIPNLFAYDGTTKRLLQVSNVLTGAFQPDVTPDGRYIYFAGYHADGYHIERMPFDTASWKDATPARAVAALRPRVALDSAAELLYKAAPSEERGYNPWQTLRPRYWLPYYSAEGVSGTFLGVSTGGDDLLRRHGYSLGYAHEFERNRNSGYFRYGYAGLRQPTLGFALVRDWDFVGRAELVRAPEAPDTSLVDVVEREDVAEFTTTFVRRRLRSSLTLTLGAEAVLRRRLVNDTPNVQFNDERDRMYGPVVRLGYANYRTPALSISREDGILIHLAGRRRFERDTAIFDRGYAEFTSWNALYKSLTLPGFAHHVIAARVSALVREGSSPPLAEVGGVPGGAYDLGITSVGTGGGLLPVRGFEQGDRAGTRAWSASLEYRAPIALVGRGINLWPLFLDKMYVTGFVDAGNARCDDVQRARSMTCRMLEGPTLLSVGGELGVDLGLVSFFNTRMRISVAQPLRGPSNLLRADITFGASF